MAYIGNQTTTSFTSLDKQTITGDGGTAYTLSHAVANAQEIEVFVNNVRQEPGVAYTVSGTALTMTGNVASTDDFYVVFQAKAIQSAVHPSDHPLNATTGTFTGDLTVDTDTLVVDAANNRVGIGQSTPDAELHIGDGSGSSDNTRLRITGGTSGQSTIQLGDTASANIGQLQYDHSSNFLAVRVNAAERMRIDSSGRVGIGTTSMSNALQVQGNGARLVNSSATNALHLFAYNSNNNATISLYDNSGSHNVLIDGSSIPHLGIGSTSRMIGSEIVSIVGSNSVYGATIVNKSSYASGGTSVNGMYFLASNSNTAGYISWNGSSTSYNTSSDHRMKQGVEDMTGAIARVKQLAPKRFQFIDATDVTVDGFIAHEAQTVVPEAVRGTHNEVDEDGNAVMQGIDQSKLVPLLTGALQEAIAKIETLETEMTALKARVTALEDA